MNERSILIVGAGPVGLAAAVQLVRRGFSPRIVDAGDQPTPENQSRALAILPITMEVFAASGLTDRFLSQGHRIEGFEIRRNGRRAFTLRSAGARTPYPFILALPQGSTERIMIEWLKERGVEVEWERAFASLADTHRPSVTFDGGETSPFDIVIGADGPHSPVREAVGIPLTGEDYPTEFALADVVYERLSDPHLAQVDIRGTSGARATIPFAPDRARVIGAAPSTEELLAGVSNVRDIAWASRFTVAFRRAERMAKGRVFLVGDAAHVHSPVGGRGMNLGIWDAATLAFLLQEGRESEYETQRLPVVKKVLASTHRATDLVTSRPAGLGIGLSFLGPVLSRIPFVSGRLAERLLALDLPRPEGIEPAGEAPARAG